MNESNRQFCKVHGLLHYHTYNSQKSQEGFPDWVIVPKYQPEVVYAEFKNATRPLTDDQRVWLICLLHKRQYAFVIRPLQLEMFLDLLVIPPEVWMQHDKEKNPRFQILPSLFEATKKELGLDKLKSEIVAGLPLF